MTSELNLVEAADLRLALAESEAQFEQALALFLPPVLLKLASSDARVRQAVFRTVQNVFPRITAARTMQLPVAALLEQAKAPNVPAGADTAAVRLYSLLFVAKGVDRLLPQAQASLVPRVVAGIATSPRAVAARLFAVLVKVLASWRAPEHGSTAAENMRRTLGFTAGGSDEAFLAHKIACFFMLQPNVLPQPVQSPGLAQASAAFFTADAGVAYTTHAEITAAKQRFLEFLRAGFADQALAVPLLVASADPLTALAEAAQARYKRLDVDLEDAGLVAQLVSLFLGTPPDVPPASPVLQERILSVLCKSSAVVAHPQVGLLSETGLLSEYARLRQTAVAFVRKVSAALLPPLAPGPGAGFSARVAARLKEGIVAEGWPQMDRSRVTNFRAAVGLRGLQYEALGDVLRNSPGLWRDDLAYVKFLYASLEREAVDLVPTLQGVLSALSIHLPVLSAQCKTELRVLLRMLLQSPMHDNNLNACKYLAIKYANCTFSFDDAEARFLCILGAAKENNLETREEADRGLHPYHFNMLKSSNTADYISSREYLGLHSLVAFPRFTDMVLVLSRALSDPAEAARHGERAIKFTLHVLAMQAITGKSTVVVADEEWARRIDKALEVDDYVRLLVVSEIESLSKIDTSMHDNDTVAPSLFHVFLNLIFEGSVTSVGSTHGSVFALLISLSPPSVIGSLSLMIPGLAQNLRDKILLTGDLNDASKILAIIATHEDNDIGVAFDILTSFAKRVSTSNDKEKFISVSAHILAKLALRQRIEEIDLGLLENFYSVVHDSLGDARLYDTCIEGLSQLAIFGVMGPRLSLNAGAVENLRKYTEKIESKLKSFHENSVLALSKLALALPLTYDSLSDQLLPIEKRIFDAHVSKQIEFIFTCGDALLILAGGWLSKLLRQNIDIQGQTVEYVPMSTGRLGPILSYVLHATVQSKPALRKAGCIWLLAIVQYLPNDPIISEKAAEIHSAFMRYLVDRDEMVQEAAARGLSLVYDLGNADLKETLVKGLLRSFTDSNASNALSSGSVDLETQLFEKDVLKTHDSSVSTYKDVLTLASDVGDPSLVYKFMSLAKSNALWSSRRGMAYGLGSILSKSSLDQMLSLNPSLSKRLIPKLYRYRFDPNQGVSQSMKDIWTSLIGDTPKIVREYFDPILLEILKGMGSKEWRVRQASAVALNNLLQTQPIEKYEAKLEDVWSMSFRAMDDIKESVRKEGQNLSKTLARVLIRSADLSTGKVSATKAAELLDHLIPMFMGSKGLLSDVEEVRAFALETILKLCDIGGKAIKLHIPALLSNFIELMSTLEPEIINYLVLNADKYKLDSNDVDAKRLQSLGHSPMMDAIEKLMNQIDEPMMPEIMRHLKVSIKRSIGLPSKVCGSRVIVNLVSHQTAIVRPYGDAMLALCVSHIKDRNATVSLSFAVAAGYCCKIATIDALVEYSKKIESMYLAEEDSKTRKLAAVASEAVSRYSGADKFDLVASAFLPLAFIGKHDGDTDVSAAFEKEWVEYSSGNNAIKLYFHEIFAICEVNIRSNDYQVRQTIARTIVDICQSTESLLSTEVASLLAMVLEACKGKSWQGKELVFGALVMTSLKNADFLRGNESLMDLVVQTIKLEQKRRNKAYQLRVILSVAKFIKNFPDNRELVGAYIDIMRKILTDEYLEDADLVNTDSSLDVEEWYLSYIRNVVLASPAHGFDDDIFALALALMKEFKASGHELTWKTCFSFNENFQILLGAMKVATLNETQLSAVAKSLAILIEFTDMYKLEKNAIIFARNVKLAKDLFCRHERPDLADQVVQVAQRMLTSRVSSVVKNELEIAIS